MVVLEEDAYSEGEQVVDPEATEFEISAIQDLIKHQQELAQIDCEDRQVAI